MIDAQDGVTAQDAHVAEFILDAFRSVAVIVNKWDAVEDKDSNTINEHTEDVRQRMKFFSLRAGAVHLGPDEAAGEQGAAAGNEHRRAAHRADSDQRAEPHPPGGHVMAHPAPSRKGKPLKFLYATQAETAPPTFIIFVNDKELVHFSYERFLENRIREVYPFEGTPIRLFFRSRDESRDN